MDTKWLTSYSLEIKSMRLEILRDLSGLEVSMGDLQGSKPQRNSKQTTFMRLGVPVTHGGLSENKSMRLEILGDLSGLEVSMADLQGSKSQRNSKQSTFMRLGAPRRMED